MISPVTAPAATQHLVDPPPTLEPPALETPTPPRAPRARTRPHHQPATSRSPTSPPPSSSPSAPPTEPVPDCAIENRWGRDVAPQVRQVACLLDDRYPGITALLGVGPGSVPGSDHPKGLAVDVMINQDRVTGDAIAACAARHFEDWGLSYVLWRQADLDKEGGEFEPMADRGSATANHLNHVHLSFHRRSNPIPEGALTCDDDPR